MKSLLVGINAKYIHTNLAIRLLKKNTNYQTDIMEFTTKDNVEHIVSEIIKFDYNIVGFSCYIWNITFIVNCAKLLKEKNPNIKIILGGPEVSYNAEYYINNRICDYVIKNEGEEAYDRLLQYLDNKLALADVPNLYYQGGYTYDKLVNLDKMKMAYDLQGDFVNRIIYIETSRGCPYKCSYCMASLDNKVRFFNIDEIKKQLLYLIENKARVFKFLDRTFNANKKNFVSLIAFIIKNHQPNNSFQFEITGDLLDSDVIDYINSVAPKGLIRFEIGIQSTNILSNKLVYRIQNNEKLFNNIRKIIDANVIDLHLDLIAGLPKEDYESFKNTFNEVLSLRPLELQLGFLKILHGTKLETEVDLYGYVYDKNPPYEILYNDSMSSLDINNIHKVEDVFEIYYNKGYFKNSIQLILDNELNHFDFFDELGRFLNGKENRTLKQRFTNLMKFIENKKYYDLVIKEIYLDYLQYFKLKPEPIWPKLSVSDKKELVREVLLLDQGYDIDTLSRYSILIPVLDSIVIGVYKPNKLSFNIIKK